MEENTLIRNPEKIQLNNIDEIDQLLGNPPSWIVQWGLMLVLVATLILGAISWLIKYPDILAAPITLTTENPAIRVVAETYGKIDQLKVSNNEWVKEKQVIALIENPIPFEDIQKIEAFVNKVDSIRTPRLFLQIKSPSNLSLGKMQNFYADLLQKISNLNHLIKQTLNEEKIKSYKRQIMHLQALNENLLKQKENFEKEVTLLNKNYQRNVDLNKEGLLSNAELEIKETEKLQTKRQLESLTKEYINNQIIHEQLLNQIMELGQKREDDIFNQHQAIKNDAQKIKNEIAFWKHTYLITAPISGKIAFSKIWSDQQFLKANEEILTIVPGKGAGNIIGKATLPILNSGKVQAGQQVNIQLDGFPYQEFGVIKAAVSAVALIPSTSLMPEEENNYIVEINLPDSLTTTYQKMIPFRQEMTGTANIITEERRIIHRIFDRIYSILKNS